MMKGKAVVKSPLQASVTAATMGEQHMDNEGLYLIDFGFAEECQRDNDGVLFVEHSFRGTVRYASSKVLATLAEQVHVRYTELDEWHSVIRTLYALSNTKIHETLTAMQTNAYQNIDEFWGGVLTGVWDCSDLTEPVDFHRKAREIVMQVFPRLEYED